MLLNLKLFFHPFPNSKKSPKSSALGDKAIETTEKLIEAKTKLKKGLMQRLLTGQTRFKGFQESWTQYEFGQLAKLCTLKFDPKKESKIYKCIELEHLSQETGQLLGFTYSNLQLSQKNKFESRDVLFGKLRPYLRKYFNPDFEGVCSSEIWVLKGFPSLCDNKFLFYLVQSHEFIQLANSTTGTKMPRADWDFLSEFPFRLPPLPEQQKIAQILTACDQEIELLSKKLEKLKQQKKGLMQKLLTGQIRVQLSEQD
jgi:type I restriction enzyme S subunit